YECEYQVQLHYERNKKRVSQFVKMEKGSFALFFSLPQDATKVWLSLHETDSGEIRTGQEVEIPLKDQAQVAIADARGTFAGKLLVEEHDFEQMQKTYRDHQSFSLDYTQTDCFDGFLNYDCEYRID